MPRLKITDYKLQTKSLTIGIFLVSLFCYPRPVCCAQESKIEEPITINGDIVEYATDNKEVTVTGNAEVIYKGMKLTW